MNVILIAALLGGSKILPQIDREALDIQARAEAQRPRAAVNRPTQRQPVARRAAGGHALDLASITTICRAAGEQGDPAVFIGRLTSAYSLSAGDSAALRSSCAAYLAGRADARRASGGSIY
jgi:hypothetical protein